MRIIYLRNGGSKFILLTIVNIHPLSFLYLLMPLLNYNSRITDDSVSAAKDEYCFDLFQKHFVW